MPKLYAIEKQEDLVGKTVAIVDMHSYDAPMLLVTTDGGIMAWTTYSEYEEDGIETNIYTKGMVEGFALDNQNRLKDLLVDDGFCTEEDIIEYVATEKRDRHEFERLKNKFGGCRYCRK